MFIFIKIFHAISLGSQIMLFKKPNKLKPKARVPNALNFHSIIVSCQSEAITQLVKWIFSDICLHISKKYMYIISSYFVI